MKQVPKLETQLKLGQKVERTKLGYRLITSSRYIDQSLKDMDMEKCNPVRTPGLQELATEEQPPESLAGLSQDSDQMHNEL